MSTETLSIVIPAFNEANRIHTTLERIHTFFKIDKIQPEVIVVDDGSTDDTVERVSSFYEKLPNLTVLQNIENHGKGYSVRRGMLQAKGSYRLFMDADNSVDISHVGKFLDIAHSGVDVAIGSIKCGTHTVLEHNGFHRRALGSLANTLIQLFAVPGILDTQRGFKLFSARAAESIFPRQTIDRFGFDIEVLLIARLHGFEIQELPVVWDNPSGSKVTLKSYMQTLGELYCICRNRFLQRYDTKANPLLVSKPTQIL